MPVVFIRQPASDGIYLVFYFSDVFRIRLLHPFYYDLRGYGNAIDY